MLPLVLPFPNIDPIALQVGPLAIRWYGLAYIVGILIGWFYANRLVRRDRIWNGVARPTAAELDDFVIWATLGIVLGGRIGYVLFYNPAHYLTHPAEIPMVWLGGMSFHGGFIGSMLAMALFARKRAFSVWTLFDIFTAAAPIGLFFGRLANFINSELWGRAAEVPWAMVFPNGGPFPRHPSQLYEAGLEGLVLFAVLAVGIWRRGWLATPGYSAGVFTLGYGLSRVIVEFFREPDAQIGYLAGGITMGQVLSLPMVIGGVGVMLYALKHAPAARRAG